MGDAKEALDLIAKFGLTTADFSGGSRSWANTFYKILQYDYRFSETFVKTIEGDKSWFAQSSPKIQQIEEAREGGVQDLGMHILSHYERYHRSYNSAVLLLKNIYSYGILSYIDDNLVTYRSENNLVLLSDHAFLLNQVIDNKDAPIIYEKIGSRFKHILIDEFQDTSLYQWRNILPLVKNVLENFGQVLIVGDVKQSIYRWRGGDMKLLISGIQEDLQLFGEQTLEKELDTNYRSEQNIVLFNNSFFETACNILSENSNIPSNDALIQETYHHLKQKPNKKEDGYIEMRFFQKEEDLSWDDKAKERTIRVIEENLKLGYSPGDFLILVDKWTRGYEIAEYLIQNNYKVITDKSLKVESNTVVRLLINAIKWLHNSEDKLAKTNLLYLYYLLSEKSFKNADLIFSDIHNQDELFLTEMPEYFVNNLKVFLRLPLYELVENLIIAFDLSNHTNNFVLRFQEICLEQSAKGRNDLPAFLQWWDESKDDLVVITPDIDDAFEIMTIHKAKGLQKPIVIIPFADYQIGSKFGSVFWTTKIRKGDEDFKILPLPFEKRLAESDFEEAYHKEYLDGILERLNMTYVAFTRAEQKLYVFAQSSKETPEPGYINQLMNSVFGTFGYEEMWNQTDGEFIWGDKYKKPLEKKKEEESVETLEIYKSSEVGDNISIKSESGRFFMLFDNSKSESIKQGILLHSVFENLENYEDLDSVIIGLVSEGMVAEDKMGEVLDLAKQIFENDLVQSWFDGSWTVFNERVIVSPDGLKRPDRVMIKDDEVVIVDYKSGARDPKHDKQLRQYRDLLHQMNYNNIRMYLMYFNKEGLVEVN